MATGTARDKVLTEQYRNEAITKKPTDGNDYGGLQIHAFRGLHEFVAEGLMRRCQAGGRVVDLAAGTGAMSKRLVDLGFQVTASDLVTENFRLADEIPFVTTNFNDKFSSCFKGGFDALVAVEIIEHMECLARKGVVLIGVKGRKQTYTLAG